MESYLVVYMDDSGDMIVPALSVLPHKAFKDLKAAAAVAKDWMESFQTHRPVLYGEAFPFENDTLESKIKKDGLGPVGWVVVEDDEGPITYCIMILRLE